MVIVRPNGKSGPRVSTPEARSDEKSLTKEPLQTKDTKPMTVQQDQRRIAARGERELAALLASLPQDKLRWLVSKATTGNQLDRIIAALPRGRRAEVIGRVGELSRMDHLMRQPGRLPQPEEENRRRGQTAAGRRNGFRGCS